LTDKKTTSKRSKRLPSQTETSLLPSSYPELLSAIKSRLSTARVKAHLAANRELIQLYWDLGQLIVQQQRQEGWGKAIVEKLSIDLRRDFPEMSGLTVSNLWNARKFFLAYGDPTDLQQAVGDPDPARGSQANLQQPVGEILRQAVADLEAGQCPELLLTIPWGHNLKLTEKLKDPRLRLWYADQTTHHGWSRAVLVHQIESELHLRAESHNNNFPGTLPDTQSDLARELIKDSFNLEFLDVREDLRERELEDSLIANLRNFLLELGTGFAFIGNQYRLEVGDQDYFLDLLFYHTHLHCYIVIELKVDAFKPEYAGKMQFYLAATDDLLKSEQDSPSIGILLCKEKNKVIVEYALRDSSKPIAVSDYTLKKTLPKELKGELPSAATLKKQLLEGGDE